MSAGGTWTQALWDDGLHDDGTAGDGVLGAWIGPLVPGAARVAVQVEGRAADGARCAPRRRNPRSPRAARRGRGRDH